MLAVYAAILTCQTGLATTNKSLKSKNLFIVKVTFFFPLNKSLNSLITVLYDFIATISKNSVETIDKVHESANFFITHSDITRCLVSYMHVVVLLHQSANGSAHRDDIIVGVGREYYNTLWVGLGTLGTCRIVYIRFSTGPTCYGVLKFVEYLDVYQTCLAIELFYKMAQTVFNIIFGRKFKQRLLHLLAKFNNLAPQLMVGHLDVVSQI